MRLFEGSARRGVAIVLGGVALALSHACSAPDRDFSSGDETGGQAGATSAAGSSSGGKGSGAQGSGAQGSGGAKSSGGSKGSGATGGSGGTTSSECGDTVCEHGGACIEDELTFSCDCSGTGYTGDTCEDDIDECADSPCENDSECVDTPGSYECDCSGVPTHAGRHCDQLRFELLPEGFTASALSADGSVVVGKDAYGRAVKYVDGEVRLLGSYVGDLGSVAHAVSSDGRVVFGESSLNDTSRAVRWSGTGITLMEMPEGYKACAATSVTPDGRFVAGTCDGNVVRWVDGELEELGVADGVMACSASTISADGRTIGGACFQSSYVRAFVWNEDTGFVILIPLSQATQCRVEALSFDGSLAIGSCSTTTEGLAVYWGDSEGARTLHNTETGVYTVGNPRAMTSDGSLIVGNNSVAAVWTGIDAEIQPLVDRLPTGAANAWALKSANDVSENGKVILGTATIQQPEYTERSFLARLD